jgi:glucan biosynthesis protein C
MIENVLQPTVKSPVRVATMKASRLFFSDHLRAALVILVVLHHVALVYGGIQPFYYLEPPRDDLIAFLVPMIFVLLNQAWFMGAFFLLAGYFTPGAFDRKGSGSFLKSRLIRLGVPLIVWIFVLNPISSIGFFLMPASLTGIQASLTWQSFWQMYPDLLGLGPLWFVAMLLIFSFGYVAWRKLTGNRTTSARLSSPPSYRQIVVFILALAVVSYLMRMVIPLGKSLFDFPTLAYLPQYLSFFVLGTVAYRQKWFRRLPNSMGVAGFVAALAATSTLFPIGFISFLKAIENASPQIPPFGFGTWQSTVYTLWDTIFAVGMCLAAITFFRRFFNMDNGVGRFLSRQSYTVYIIHIPIIIFLAYGLRGIELANLWKFGMAAIIVVPTCFVLAYIVRKIPAPRWCSNQIPYGPAIGQSGTSIESIAIDRGERIG